MDVIERIQEYLKPTFKSARDGFDALPGGLLLGTIRSVGNPEITDFRVGRLNTCEISAALREHEGASPEPVGYFRSSTDESLSLTADDLSLARTFFCNPSSVFLLIHSFPSGPPKAGFFFWDQGQLSGEFCFLEFPFDARSLSIAADGGPATVLGGQGDVSRLVPTDLQSDVRLRAQFQSSPQPNQLSSSDASTNLHPDNSRRPKHRRNKIASLLLGATILAVAVTFAGLPRLRLAFDRIPSTSAPLHVPQESANSVGLGLHAEGRGEGLLVSWARAGVGMQLAQRAILGIQDGDHFRELRLDKGQITEGSVLYLPKSDDVLFRMEVYFEGRTVSESIRVLGGPVQPAPVTNAVPARFFSAAEHPKDQPANRDVPNVKPSANSPSIGEAKRSTATVTQSPIIAQTEQLVASSQSSTPMPVIELPTSNLGRELQERAAALMARPVSKSSLLGEAPGAAQGAPPPKSGGSYVSSSPIRRVMPSTSMLGTAFYRPETIAVRLQIDENGRVTAVRPAGKAAHENQFLLVSVIEAARRWTFKPAQLNGKKVPSEQTLVFQFRTPDK
jgi:hypothetical protein